MKKVIICSGSFDPLHPGHISMFKGAKSKGDFLVVCLYSDKWIKNKRKNNFLDFDIRKNIISSIKYVDDVMGFEDDDGSSVNGIKSVIEKYKTFFTKKTLLTDGEIYSEEPEEVEFTFASGSVENSNSSSYPFEEQKYCEENGIGFIWGVGGAKENSSTSIIKRYTDWFLEKACRKWGNYRVIYQDLNKKVKIIEIEPKKSISLQTHSRRSEHWVVVEGTATIYLESSKRKLEQVVEKNESIYVHIGEKHKIVNNTDKLLQIVEVQIGDYLEEDDIIRYD